MFGSSYDSAQQNIRIKVVAQDGAKLNCIMNINTRLEKLKRAFGERMEVPIGALRFLFDGLRIIGDETPRQLGMENDDMVEVYIEQTGGGYKVGK